MALRRSKRLQSLSSASPSPSSSEALPGPEEEKAVRAQAFSIPEIFETIASYLVLQDQKTCRSVCKMWNREVSRMFRTNHYAVIWNDFNDTLSFRNVSDLCEIVKRGNELQLPSPFKELKLNVWQKDAKGVLDQLKGLDFPVTVIEIVSGNSSLACNQMDYANNCLRLIKSCAPLLTHLKVPSLGLFENVSELMELKCLTVLFTGCRHRHALSEAVINQGYFFAKLVASAPKLQEVHIDEDASSVRDNPPPTSFMYKFLSVADLTKIQVLSVDVSQNSYNLSPDDFEFNLTSLKSLKINELKSLRISRSWSDSNEEINFALLSEAIAPFSNSLEEFSTNCLSYFSRTRFILPVCPKLRSLDVGRITFSELELSNLPNLKKFKIIGLRQDTRRDKLVPISSVESVSFGVSEARTTGAGISWADFVKQVFDWFPNVKNWEVSDPWFHSALTDHIEKHQLRNQIVMNRVTPRALSSLRST